MRPFELLVSALALCAPVAAAASAASIELTAVGDIYISEASLKNLSELEKLPPAQIIFGNFEGAIGTPDQAARRGIIHAMPGETVDFLGKYGFNVLSLANNHVLDLGEPRFQSTKQVLLSHAIEVADGSGPGVVLSVGERKIRVVAFSFDAPNNVNDIERAAALIRSFKEDIIVVSAHMGREGKDASVIHPGVETFGSERRGDVTRFSQAMINAGASLVLGHSPHAPRKLEIYRERLIVYSLGNFIFDLPEPVADLVSPAFALHVQMDSKGRFEHGVIKSYVIRNGRPLHDPSQRAAKLIQKLSQKEHLRFVAGRDGYLVTPDSKR